MLTTKASIQDILDNDLEQQRYEQTKEHKMTKEEIIEFIRQNIRIEVESNSVYSGRCDGPMYDEIKTIKLVFCNEVLSEVDV